MRILILLLTLVLIGCAKKEQPHSDSAAVDIKMLRKALMRENINLLAIKHGLPPEKAELATWDYSMKHDIGFRITMDENALSKDGKQLDIFVMRDEMSRGIPDSVRDLSVKYGLEERAFAAFLFDLKLADKEKE